MIVVSNTTPLIGLSLVGRLELLKSLFDSVYIPPAVQQEITGSGATRPGAEEVERAVAAGWLRVETARPGSTLAALQVDLGDGEAEAIALAAERSADLLLIDERKGRAKAVALGLTVMGTIGVLLFARERGLDLELRPALDRLRASGFRISDALYQRILAGK